VSFAAIALCVASQRVFIVVSVHSVIDLHPRNCVEGRSESRKHELAISMSYKGPLRDYSLQTVAGILIPPPQNHHLRCVQTGTGADPASCPPVIGCSYHGGKATGA
jgi:hypothetical protein